MARLEPKLVRDIIALCAALSGLAYLVPKLFQAGGLDFRLIWLAGKLWREGKNPYGPEFLADYLVQFGNGPNTHFWVYPPYWFPVSELFAALPFETSLLVWGFFNLALLVTGTYLVARCYTKDNAGDFRFAFGLGLFFACTLQATAVTVSIGQTSILVYFGLCCLLYGVSMDRMWLVVAGLIALALKPNLGLLAFAAVALLPAFRMAIAYSSAAILAAMATFASDPGQVVDFLHALGKYYAPNLGANSPPNLVGLVHFLPFVPAIAILLLGLIMMFIAHRKLIRLNESFTETFPLLVAIFLFFTSLHSYDLVALAIPFVAMLVERDYRRWIIVAGLLLCYRSGNLALASGLSSESSNVFPESLLATIGVTIILVGLTFKTFYGPLAVRQRTTA